MSAAPSEELDFRSSIEALFVEALKDQMTPKLRERLREVGIDLDKLAPAYPRMVFARGCRVAIEELFPGDPPDVALRRLGQLLMEGFTRTFFGKAVMGVFKLIGVRRSLDRITRGFRSGDNYTQVKFEIVKPCMVDLTISQVNGQPTFSQGMLETCMDWVAAKDRRVEILRQEGDGCVYRLQWSEA